MKSEMVYFKALKILLKIYIAGQRFQDFIQKNPSTLLSIYKARLTSMY